MSRDDPAGRVPPGRSNLAITIILAVQIGCAVLFVFTFLDMVFAILDEPLNWMVVELIELGAALGLVLGSILGVVAIRRSDARRRAAENRLHDLTRAFHELMQARFRDWDLTPAERDVALFVVKGFSTQEIAGFRSTSEGTVKAQTNAIYRKAGVTGRVQLLGLFIEDLANGELPGVAP